MSSIFKWMVVLLLMMAVAGGAGVYWYYLRSDEMLRTEVLKHLSRIAPDLKFSIERASFDFSGRRIRIYSLAARLPGDVEPSLEVQQADITLDEDPLTDFQNIVVERIRILHPRLRAVKQRDGRWNWQDVKFESSGSPLLPHFELEHGTVIAELLHEHAPLRKVKLSDLNVTAAPAAARKIAAVVSTRIEPAGPLSAAIEADLDHPEYSLEARWLKLPVDEDLLNLLGEFSPSIQAKFDDTRRMLAEMASRQAAADSTDRFRADSIAGESSPTRMQSQLQFPLSGVPAGFGVKCDCNLHIKLRKRFADDLPSFEALAEIQGGQINHPLLPFPLHQVYGSVYADAHNVIFRNFSAENGTTRVSLDARLTSQHRPEGKLSIRNLAINQSLKARLPEATRKILDPMSIDGICDLDLASVLRDGETSLEADLRLSQGVVCHERFPYVIRDVNGSVTLRANTIEIRALGKASGVPVTLNGRVSNPGPENETSLVIQAMAVPINSAFIEACRPAGVQRAITDLSLQGNQDVWVHIWKPGGVGHRFMTRSKLVLNDCTCQFKGFPYRITRLHGEVHSTEDAIVLKDLRGQHDATEVTASGVYHRIPAPGRLELTLRAENAAFDRSLEAALPASVLHAWQEFQPTGRLDVETKVDWTPGQPCHIELPWIRVSDAKVTMRGFAWPLHSVRGEFSYQAPRLVIKSISAQHDETQIQGRGVALFVPGEPWRVRFNELHVDDLVPNSTFRKALPQQLGKVFESLNPTGKFSIETARQTRSGVVQRNPGWVELSGGGGELSPLTASWDIQLILAECSLTAGTKVEDIHGRVDLAGEFDGKSTTLDGRLDLDSISVFRQSSGQIHQISRVVGPIKLRNGEFTAGSRLMTAPTSERVPPSEQVSGEAIDGRMNLNVVAKLQGEPEYRIGLALNRGRLETYARQYLRGQSNLAGIMNGWLYLWGKGASADQIHGSGMLMVSPAALYELPLFVQVFRVFRLDSADRTAFDSAEVVYTIENSRFDFRMIDLVGSTISLRGRGYVRFDGAMQLDFYSMQPRSRVQIPILHEVVGAISRGWMGVKITGTVGAPNPPQIIPVPELEDAIKQFLGTFEPPQPASRPNLPSAPRRN